MTESDDASHHPAAAAAATLNVVENSGRSPVQVEVGAAAPVPFSNDIFEGQIFFYACNAPGAAVDITAGRTFELQVQGRFKRDVEHFFMGIELTEGLGNLGLMTRGLALSLLRMIKVYEPTMHTSLGNKDLSELPHVRRRPSLASFAVPSWPCV